MRSLLFIGIITQGVALRESESAPRSLLRNAHWQPERKVWQTTGGIDCPAGHNWVSIFVGSGEVRASGCDDFSDSPDVRVDVTVNGVTKTTSRDDE